jgi:hypothetical protein
MAGQRMLELLLEVSKKRAGKRGSPRTGPRTVRFARPYNGKLLDEDEDDLTRLVSVELRERFGDVRRSASSSMLLEDGAEKFGTLSRGNDGLTPKRGRRPKKVRP